MNKKNKTSKIPLLLPFIFLLLVIILPAFYSLFLSFHDYTFGMERVYVSLENWVDIIFSADLWQILFRNIIFVIAVVIGEIVGGTLIGLLMSTGFPLQKFFISIIMSPYAVSPVIAVMVWDRLLRTDVGFINYLLTNLNLPQFSWAGDPTLSMILLIVIQVWIMLPFSFLIIYSAIIGIPQTLLEAAEIDGAGLWQRIRYIILPLIKPAIMVAALFRLIFSLRAFAVPWILTEGGPAGATELLSIRLYKTAFRFWRFGQASAWAWIITLITLLIASYYLVIFYRRTF